MEISSDSTRDGAAVGEIGLLGALAIGVGGMVGGGIFAVLGEAVSLAHGGTAIAFLIAGVVAALTAHAYARLAVHYRGAGGTVVFVHKAFGIDLATGTLNLILWLSYLVTLSLYAVAFGSYARTFFSDDHGPWLRHALISAGLLLPMAANLVSAAFVSRSETAVVVIKLAILAVVVASGLGQIDGQRLAPATWSGPLTLVAAGMVIFVAYEGFELIANAAGDVRDPQRTLPRAFYGSVFGVIALYVLVAVVTVGAVPEERIAAAKDYALAEAAQPALGHVGFVLVSIAALLATLSAINATLYGNARLGFILARDGELPALLKVRAWDRPVSGVLTSGGIALLLANTIDLRAISTLASAGFLLVFMATNAAGARLAATIGARRGVCVTAALACLAALTTLLVHTAQEDPLTLAYLAAFVVFSLVFEVVYPRLVDRPLKLGVAPAPDADENGIGV